MTPEEREEMIKALAIRHWGRYKESYFAQLSDEDLQERYNKMIEVEMEGRL